MTHVAIDPASRSVPPGTEAAFRVRVEGSGAAKIRVFPCHEARDYTVLLDGRGRESAAVTGEHKLQIRIPRRTPTILMDFFVEARDASGHVVAAEHAEVLTASRSVVLGLVVAVVAGMAGFLSAVAFLSGWLGVLTAAVTSVLVAVGLLGLALLAWGRFVGFPWHFRP